MKVKSVLLPLSVEALSESRRCGWKNTNFRFRIESGGELSGPGVSPNIFRYSLQLINSYHVLPACSDESRRKKFGSISAQSVTSPTAPANFAMLFGRKRVENRLLNSDSHAYLITGYRAERLSTSLATTLVQTHLAKSFAVTSRRSALVFRGVSKKPSKT